MKERIREKTSYALGRFVEEKLYVLTCMKWKICIPKGTVVFYCGWS